LRTQLRTAERAIAAGQVVRERTQDALATLESLRRLPSATPEQRRDVVQALVAPGGAVFRGGKVHLELLVRIGDEQASADATPSAKRPRPVLAPVHGRSGSRETSRAAP